MSDDPLRRTRLFHAIVVLGAALGSAGCGAVDGACHESHTSLDAGADVRLGDGGEPCPIDATPWPPTK